MVPWRFKWSSVMLHITAMCGWKVEIVSSWKEETSATATSSSPHRSAQAVNG